MPIADVVLWPIAGAMAAIIAGLIRWAAGARSRVASAVVLFLLAMMAAMFLGAALYFASPGTSSLVLGLWIAAALMGVAVFPVFVLAAREVSARIASGAAYRPPALRSVWSFALAAAFLVFAGEAVMGRAFELASGGGAVSGPGAAPLLSAALVTLTSRWFLFPMAAEMAASVLLLGRRFPRSLRAALALQAFSMVASPTALSAPGWTVASSLAAAVLTAGIISVGMLALVRGEQLPASALAYLTLLMSDSVALAAGVGLWLAGGSSAVIAAAAIGQMLLFFTVIVVPERFGLRTEVRGHSEPTLGPGGDPRPG